MRFNISFQASKDFNDPLQQKSKQEIQNQTKPEKHSYGSKFKPKTEQQNNHFIIDYHPPPPLPPP